MVYPPKTAGLEDGYCTKVTPGATERTCPWPSNTRVAASR